MSTFLCHTYLYRCSGCLLHNKLSYRIQIFTIIIRNSQKTGACTSERKRATKNMKHIQLLKTHTKCLSGNYCKRDFRCLLVGNVERLTNWPMSVNVNALQMFSDKHLCVFLTIVYVLSVFVIPCSFTRTVFIYLLSF
jgi:hypothetical protein